LPRRKAAEVEVEAETVAEEVEVKLEVEAEASLPQQKAANVIRMAHKKLCLLM